MPFDVFVSHSSKDKLVANAACARLEAAGIRCWIAPRDIVAGTSYGESIIEAIRSVKVMVLVLSANANSSGHIPKEVERAVSNGVAILPFRIEDVPPGKSLDYFIGSVHWLDAMTPPLEKHLDELVETVQKLIQPVGAIPASQTSHSGAFASTSPAFSSVMRPAGSVPQVPRAGKASPKGLWIGIAAAVVVAAIILGVIFLRPKPPGPISPTVNPSPNPPVVTPNPSPAPGPPPSAAADPIVGCYHWFNNGSVFIHSNGVVLGGPFTGHWRLISAAQRKYTFTWPAAIDTVTVKPDQRSLSGSNQYGFPIAATRTVGAFGIIGTWNMSNNVPLVVSGNGAFSAGTISGTWQAVDASRGIYTLTWPDPVDSVTLSADAQTISGANQYGVATSGTRVEPCNAN